MRVGLKNVRDKKNIFRKQLAVLGAVNATFQTSNRIVLVFTT